MNWNRCLKLLSLNIVILLAISCTHKKEEFKPEFWFFKADVKGIKRGPVTIECGEKSLSNFVCMDKSDLQRLHNECF